jgi:hypothetical protein
MRAWTPLQEGHRDEELGAPPTGRSGTVVQRRGPKGKLRSNPARVRAIRIVRISTQGAAGIRRWDPRKRGPRSRCAGGCSTGHRSLAAPRASPTRGAAVLPARPEESPARLSFVNMSVVAPSRLVLSRHSRGSKRRLFLHVWAIDESARNRSSGGPVCRHRFSATTSL